MSPTPTAKGNAVKATVHPSANSHQAGDSLMPFIFGFMVTALPMAVLIVLLVF